MADNNRKQDLHDRNQEQSSNSGSSLGNEKRSGQQDLTQDAGSQQNWQNDINSDRSSGAQQDRAGQEQERSRK